jgi:hypothetical protein
MRLIWRQRLSSCESNYNNFGREPEYSDVIPAWSVFTKDGRETFRQTLEVDKDTWSRARGYALHQAMMIIPYYPETNPEFVTMAKRTVEQILTELK